PPPPAATAPDAQLIAAFFRGLGIEATALPGGGTAEEMEALGLRFRLLTDGLVHLLRARAREKSSVRVAQTVIGAADVNPLKFLATTEDALGALVTPRGKGYLGPEDAINAAFRDLSDHQLRTWTALQTSLRRMIDRFDPAAFEAEVEETGLVKSLIAGSRSARLWQLYAERYREIAKSAEDRFLGEVGADFRDAYEGNRRTEND
ncbi:MAG TPA: type VI secretion system-associated FHA domain protein TagH, partial [Paracoccaceae bacterium]